jgi:glycine cleavage system H protein
LSTGQAGYAIYFCVMNKSRSFKRDVYYTTGHDWIDFQGSVAYIGASMLKLMGIPSVQQLHVAENEGFAQKGEIIMSIESDGNIVPVHMPVDGKIISMNETLLGGNHQILIDQPENKGWVALIVPSKPYARDGLMQPDQYRQFVKQNPL